MGQDVSINYSSELSGGQQSAAGGILSDAAAILNANSASLDQGQVNAIQQVKSVEVKPGGSFVGADPKHQGNWIITTAYMRDASTPWIASLFAHEGQHMLNEPRWHGSFVSELLADVRQRDVGRIIGLPPANINYLTHLITNPQELQRHMEGMRY